MTVLAAMFSGVNQPLVGVSDWVRQIQAEIDSVAPYPPNVLISGPTGTGKELIARAIHSQSPRAEKPFVPVNCAALTPTIFESLMFGHVKGAFTGASFSALGSFRAADGGTIFLDEIGEIPVELQAKLLRTLQEHIVLPVGSHQEQPVDVRVIAATNRHLLQEITEDRFREDLYYRLAVVSLQTISLAERTEDLDVLSQFLIAQLCHSNRMSFKSLSTGAELRLRQHNWPGNVRELRNVLERALMLADGGLILPEDIVFDKQAVGCQSNSNAAQLLSAPSDRLPLGLAKTLGQGDANERSWPTMEEVERSHLQMTLEHTNYNQAEAARILKMHRGSVYRRIKQYGLDVSASHRGRPSSSTHQDLPGKPR